MTKALGKLAEATDAGANVEGSVHFVPFLLFPIDGTPIIYFVTFPAKPASSPRSVSPSLQRFFEPPDSSLLVHEFGWGRPMNV